MWWISCMVFNGEILWKLSVSVTVNIHNRTATFHLEQIFIPCPLTPKFLTAPFPGRVLPEGWRKFHQFSSRAGTRKRPWWSPSTTGCSRIINLQSKLQLAGVKRRWWMCSTAPRWQSFGRFLPLMMCSVSQNSQGTWEGGKMLKIQWLHNFLHFPQMKDMDTIMMEDPWVNAWRCGNITKEQCKTNLMHGWYFLSLSDPTQILLNHPCH